MKHYPQERKDAVIAKMAHHPSLPDLAKQEGISLPALYAWRRKAREKGILMPSGDDTPDGWSYADKFNAVLQTATMNDAELAEFCRAQGLYPEQIQHWKNACQNATSWPVRGELKFMNSLSSNGIKRLREIAPNQKVAIKEKAQKGGNLSLAELPRNPMPPGFQ